MANSPKIAARRAEVRAMLKEASFNQIQMMFNAGKLTESDLRRYYSDVRSDAVRQVKRIEKSSVGFIDRPPTFANAKQLRTSSDVMKAITEAAGFVRNKAQSSVAARKKIKAKAIETLHKHGMTYVNSKNYGLWVKFQRWYEAAAKQFQYGSDSDAVEEIFTAAEESGADDSEAWEQLFFDYIDGLL